MKNSDLMGRITKRVMDDLGNGQLPWEMPWFTTGGIPFNPVTGKSYRGINIFTLNMDRLEGGFSCNRWMTFKQIQAAGGRVTAGAKSSTVVFFKRLPVKPKDGEENEEERFFALLQYYRVFNIDQTTGLDHLRPKAIEIPEGEKNAAGERILEESGAKIIHGDPNRAYYDPTNDLINLPPATSFKTLEGRYSVAFHELTHWTGHKSRLDRNMGKPKGSEEYAFEELVAELGGAFLALHVGFEYNTNHSEYLKGYMGVMKDAPTALFRAAALAQNAVDLLLKTSFEKKEEAKEAA